MTGDAFRRHAETMLEETFERRHGKLASLAPDRRQGVEEVARHVVGAAVEGILSRARDEPMLAAALLSIYGAPEHSGWGLQSHRVS